MPVRVLLVYPPASQNEPGAGNLGGRDPDRLFAPYGMLTIAAELRARGFEADVVNLATLTWKQANEALRARPADLFGLSSYTFNRHATAALGAEIKQLFPESHLTVGGPHVSALPLEWLNHHTAFDTVVIGEGEATAVELAECVDSGQQPLDVPGTAYRAEDAAALAPPRALIADLDAVAKPWEHFDYGFLITSRGCPGRCTFCCSPKLWGRKVRFRSAENVLEEIEELVAARGHRYLHVKDDTFTAHNERVLAICEEIVRRKLVFRWACDTRVDSINREVLAAMRRAGCVKVNLGIESANSEILQNLRKRLDPAKALQATAEARDVGLDVRYYLIVGSRGETPGTVHQTLQFIEDARPTSCLFHGLTVYPGTEEFEIAQEQGLLSAEDYFNTEALKSDFFNMGERSDEMTHVLEVVGRELFGTEKAQAPFTTVEREQILARHPDALLSYVDLAIHYVQEWRTEDATRVLQSAAQRFGEETPELLHLLACASFAGRDFAAAQHYFHRALEAAPKDSALLRNWQTLRAAGQMNYEMQGRVAAQLFANLRSTDFLSRADGARQLTAPLTHVGGEN
ncbi:MAG: radical SAM protein [Planctomycetes bacterium]|nr:radical SAM protein [Planctomycetota bacterium]